MNFMRVNKHSYPENKAEETWERDGATFSLVKTKSLGHYCGYVRFPSRPLIEADYHGFATYVPVHGGITYANEDTDGSMVYGFDCAHAGDNKNPLLLDMDWLRAECQRMAVAISIAAGYEQDYLLAQTNEEKAAIIENYHERLKEDGINFLLTDNFGVMINILGGEL